VPSLQSAVALAGAPAMGAVLMVGAGAGAGFGAAVVLAGGGVGAGDGVLAAGAAAANHSFTPPCPEQAPDLLAADVNVPSLHEPVASAGRVAAGAGAAFGGLAVFDAAGVGASNQVFTPPWPEQAPVLVLALV